MGVASAPMNIRTIIIAVAVLALGGYALYDYYSPESKLARELKEIEQLEPLRSCWARNANNAVTPRRCNAATVRARLSRFVIASILANSCRSVSADDVSAFSSSMHVA